MEKNAVKHKKQFVGDIIKLSDPVTIKVRTVHSYTHPKYNKIIKKHKNFLVHTTDNTLKVGDKVTIEEGIPKSKNKSFYFVNKLSK